MLIECPSCASTYDLPDASITPAGRKVRCASCKTMWLVEPSARADGTPSPAKPSDVAPASVMQAAAPEAVSIEERFAADDLRLAGLDSDTGHDVAAQNGAADAEPSDVRVGEPRLRAEATMLDDPAIGADSEPDNSQDDVDALFSTPSLADFTDGAVEEPEQPANHDADGGADGDAPALAAPAARKSRARMGSMKPQKARRRISLAAAASVALVLGLGTSVLYRAPVVAAVPQTAKIFAALGLPVNLRGVEIRDVVSKVMVEQGTPQLVVEGEIVNVTRAEAKLSRLRFAIRSEKGQEIYSWKATVDKPALEPGESLKFRRRLASPPDGSVDVLVRFETRGDMIAGVQ